MPRKQRGAIARTALVLLCCVTCGSDLAHGQNHNTRYGIAATSLPGETADKIVELGAGTVRLVYGWDIIEGRCKGCFDWSVTDAWRDEARRTNRAVYGLLAYTPRWANGGQAYNYPPLRDQDWYDFVYAVVDRYRDDIFQWGIWNEPNLGAYLHGGELGAYERLTRTARAAIDAANPDASMLGPEVSWHAVKNGWFASAMQSFGEQFDIVTLHWYADGPQLEYMMDHLVRPFALGKSVWLTEVGIRPCAAFGEAGQTWFYHRVLNAFKQRQRWWTAVLFYAVHEAATTPECSMGITRSDFTNRPAFSLYQAFIRSNP